MVYCWMQPITMLPFKKSLLLMMSYCVPVLVSLGRLKFAVLLIVIAAERPPVCRTMRNANVVLAGNVNKHNAIL